MSFASSRARRYVAMAATAMATSSPAEIQTTNSRRIERARIGSRGLRDHPAHAADIADRLGTQLAAQRVDVHLDRVALDLLVPAVELLLELRARQDGAGTRKERFEHCELARRKRDALAAQPHLARDGKELDVAVR